MRCKKCGYRLLGTAYSRPGEYYAFSDNGTIALNGKICLPYRHLVCYDRAEVELAARELVRAVL